MKYNYKELTEKCKNCGGCILLESPNWLGTNKCEYADEPIQQIKQILGIQQRIEKEESRQNEIYNFKKSLYVKRQDSFRKT